MTLEQLGWFLLINVPMALIAAGAYWLIVVMPRSR